jgi:DNA polymerase III subunit epsilon
MAWWRRSGQRVDERRWLVVDVETSGLDAQSDRLLAVAAIALQVDWNTRRLAVMLGDSFEVVLRQEVASTRENILLHGIGVQRQLQGQEPAAGLQAFVDFAGSSPLLAFHSAFDEVLIGRHARAWLGKVPSSPWLDIAHLCAVAYPGVRARSLDEWLAHFHIHCAARHQASADTLAECELLLRIWPRVARECRSWADVRRYAAAHRWLANG